MESCKEGEDEEKKEACYPLVALVQRLELNARTAAAVGAFLRMHFSPSLLTSPPLTASILLAALPPFAARLDFLLAPVSCLFSFSALCPLDPPPWLMSADALRLLTLATAPPVAV